MICVCRARSLGDTSGWRSFLACVTLSGADEPYASRGWRTAASKRVVGKARDAVCVGAALDGLAGTCGFARMRRLAVIILLWRVIQLGFATPQLLRVVLGIVTSCLLYCRPPLCIFSDVYKLLHEHQHGPPRLTPGGREELWASVAFMLSETNLRVPYLPRLWITCASLSGRATVSCPAGLRPTSLNARRTRKAEKAGSQTMPPVRCAPVVDLWGLRSRSSFRLFSRSSTDRVCRSSGGLVWGSSRHCQDLVL